MILTGYTYKYAANEGLTESEIDVAPIDNEIVIEPEDIQYVDDTESPTPEQAPVDERTLGDILKYEGIVSYSIAGAGKFNFDTLTVSTLATSPATLTYDAIVSDKAGKDYYITRNAPANEWSQFEDMDPKFYLDYLWKKEYNKLFNKLSGKTKQRTVTRHRTQMQEYNLYIFIDSVIQEPFVKTTYSVMDPESKEKDGYYVKNAQVALVDISKLDQPLETEQDFDEYNKKMYVQYIRPSLTEVAPNWKLVDEQLRGDNLRRVYVAQVGKLYKIKVAYYSKDLEGQWYFDPANSAETTAKSIEEVNAYISHLKKDSVKQIPKRPGYKGIFDWIDQAAQPYKFDISKNRNKAKQDKQYKQYTTGAGN